MKFDIKLMINISKNKYINALLMLYKLFDVFQLLKKKNQTPLFKQHISIFSKKIVYIVIREKIKNNNIEY